MKLLNILDSFIKTLIAIAFAVLIIILFGEIISRYFFNFPIMWAGELARYLFIWVVYLGASIAITERAHIVVDIIVEKLPKKIQYYLETMIYIVTIAFFAFIFYSGLQYAMNHMHALAFSLRWIRMGWVYLSAPVGMLLMIISLLRTFPKKKSTE